MKIPMIGKLLLAACSVLWWGCGSQKGVDDPPASVSTGRGPEWVESTHGNHPADTAQAFPTRIRTLVVSMPESTWTAMVNAVRAACGPSGGQGTCTGSQLDASSTVSAWHRGTLAADGQTWASIGFRLRSNSDLADAWKAGKFSFPFRLTMDKWEGEVPQIKDQRFYGFKRLNLSSLDHDSSAIRHLVSSSVYRAYGVPALQGTVVNFRLARGADTLDLGPYALRELSDGPILTRWFGSDEGNLYEPTSLLGTFSAAEFSEGTNDGTFGDVRRFIEILNTNNSQRLSNPASWRADLRKVFDIDGFVRWMAVSTALGDHGSYGREAGNYGLYGLDGKVRWMALSLDNTLDDGGSMTRSVWYPANAGTWPLLEKVLADSAFCADYVRQLGALSSTGEASSARLSETVRRFGTMLSSDPSTDPRMASLLRFAQTRPQVVDTSLSAHACPH